MQKVSEQQTINKELFCAIMKGDCAEAVKVYQVGANPNAIFEVEKGKYMSIFNALVQKTAKMGKSKGPNNSQYKEHMKVITVLSKTSTLECKLANEKCPLYLALEGLEISEEREILEGKCDLIRYLIVNGATVKFEDKVRKEKSVGWKLRWFDLEGIRAYLITKNFSCIETDT